ncbi:MAG TPA: hypothetical protein EYO85_03685 [Rhodospirillales bacterium]|jgi:hypothetical protein|nr:MAG: hypothetical protein CFH02_00403 [Alphaproteobacteria bacterium MarineAlpha3_Bin1]PPR71363.1 MAG: hypothetical protein CFH03_02100 [Alphaproteobacteria bacterium MarineAlpha3_Bin2]HIC28537.1 hypothetical protein [Rhodospirillales bacterium]
MGTETDIYRTANLLIKEYGEMAPPAAFIRADQLFEKGDLSGRRVWLRVARAAEGLLSEKAPAPGDTSIH